MHQDVGLSSLMSHHVLRIFLWTAFVQDSFPSPEDPRPFQTPNLLSWSNFWPRSTAAPACRGNRWMSGCSQFGCFLAKSNISQIFWEKSKVSDCFLIVAVQVILELRERPDRAAKARRGLTLSLQPLKGFDYDSLLSPPTTPDTQLDMDTQTAAPFPGPALRLQPVPKGPRREVFV